jgi:F-type H+-transporting ATPase subunit delta
MKHLSIAKPYSIAVFLVAKEKKQIKEWHSFLTDITTLLADTEIQKLMKQPSVSTRTFLNVICENCGDITPEMHNFLMLLGEQQRLNILPEIKELFEKTWQQDQDIAKLTLVFAVQPNTADLQHLQQILKKKFGEHIEQTIEIDPSLLSGVIIRKEDVVIDASLKGQLEKLKAELIRT